MILLPGLVQQQCTAAVVLPCANGQRHLLLLLLVIKSVVMTLVEALYAAAVAIAATVASLLPLLLSAFLLHLFVAHLIRAVHSLHGCCGHYMQLLSKHLQYKTK
jgi:hypothetical protein